MKENGLHQRVLERKLEEELGKRQTGLRGFLIHAPSLLRERKAEMKLAVIRKRKEGVEKVYSKKAKQIADRFSRRQQKLAGQTEKDRVLLVRIGSNDDYRSTGLELRRNISGRAEGLGFGVRRFSEFLTYSGLTGISLYWRMCNKIGQAIASRVDRSITDIGMSIRDKRRKK